MTELEEQRPGWWERNWWVFLLLLGCLLIGFICGYGLAESMVAFF